MGLKKVPPKAGDSDENEIISEIQPAYITKIIERLSNIENKLDISNKLVKKLEAKVEEVETKLGKVEAELAAVKANYAEIVNKIAVLEDDNLAAKIAINSIQQRGRICTIRVLNMKDEVKNSREAASYIYDSLLKSSLTDPQGNHPGAMRCIEYCHLLPSPPSKEKKYPGFNYILRFHGRYFKQPIIDHKKEITEAFYATNNVKVKISQDFTFCNRQALSFLHKQDEVSKVTVRGDRLLIKLAKDGAEASWREIINPFGRKISEMIS